MGQDHDSESKSTETGSRLENNSSEDSSETDDNSFTGASFKESVDASEKLDRGDNNVAGMSSGFRNENGMDEKRLENSCDSEFDEWISCKSNDEAVAVSSSNGSDVNERETEADEISVGDSLGDETLLGEVSVGSEGESCSVTTAPIHEEITDDEGPVRKKARINPEVKHEPQETAVSKWNGIFLWKDLLIVHGKVCQVEDNAAEVEGGFEQQACKYNEVQKSAPDSDSDSVHDDLSVSTCVMSPGNNVMVCHIGSYFINIKLLLVMS